MTKRITERANFIRYEDDFETIEVRPIKWRVTSKDKDSEELYEVGEGDYDDFSEAKDAFYEAIEDIENDEKEVEDQVDSGEDTDEDEEPEEKQASRKASITEKYYEKLVNSVLKGNDAKKFMQYVYEKYGRQEWWSEWLGYSEREVINNIKDVFKEIK